MWCVKIYGSRYTSHIYFYYSNHYVYLVYLLISINLLDIQICFINSISVICMQNKSFHKVTFSTMFMIYYWRTFWCFCMSGESRARKLHDWRIIFIMSWPQLHHHYHLTINCNLWSSVLFSHSVLNRFHMSTSSSHISNQLARSRCITLMADYLQVYHTPWRRKTWQSCYITCSHISDAFCV